MKYLTLEAAMKAAAEELGWSPDDQLRFALTFIRGDRAGRREESRFRDWIWCELKRDHKRRGLEPRGKGHLLIRSEDVTDYDYGTPLYWNDFLKGWVPIEEAALYTRGDLSRLELPEIGVTVVDVHKEERDDRSKSANEVSGPTSEPCA